MSTFQINTYSASLSRIISFYAMIPNDAFPEVKEDNVCYGREMKTLFLLHGFSGSAADWMTGSLINELSMKYNLAVIMPSGENSFYLNGRGTGRGYETFTGEELPEFCARSLGLSCRPEDCFIGGLSMGGFGAIHTALKYPQRFGRMFGLSSALIVDNIINMNPGDIDEIADYEYYRQVFGDLNALSESDNNPAYLVKKRTVKGEEIQPVFMACGSEDFLIGENRCFRDFLISQGVNLTYKESPGIHNWTFWNQYLEPAIQWALGI